jgi:[acyl-carrier-protein] S-malonyltransferase
MKKRIVVVCPGRGSYTKDSLGYLRMYGAGVRDFISDIDQRRRNLNEPTISELDGHSDFKPQLHTRGEHASTLIYACSYADFMAINRDAHEIVAITGNSMGWYLTLAFSGSLDWAGAFQVVDTMGSMMKDGIIGGQVIYPVCDENWRYSSDRLRDVERAVTEARQRDGAEVYISIHLGGFVVLGANKTGVAALLEELPTVENYPFQLINHAAFHTPLLQNTSERAFATLPISLFHKPRIPMVDGRGCIWQPHSTSIEALYHYTLGHQVTEPYDFTRAISVALKEFAPDAVVLLGPGSSLGGSIGQILIHNDWKMIRSKAEFTRAQASSPFLIAMGRADQRGLVL